MFERNKGEQSREWGCLCQRCVRDHSFLLGQNTSLGPPASGEAVSAELGLKQGEESQSRGKRNPERLMVMTKVTPGDRCQTAGSQAVGCAVWCKHTTRARLAGLWFPLGEAGLGKRGIWRTQSVTKSREAIGCTPAWPSVMTNGTQVPPFPALLGGITFPGVSHSPGLSAAGTAPTNPAWGAIQGFLTESPKGNQTLKCRLNADSLCKPTNLLLQATGRCRPDLKTVVSQGKKRPNTHLPRLFQSFGEESVSSTGISEFSVIFHGSRDGSMITLVLWRCQNAPADAPVFQCMNFNTACLPYLTLLIIYFLKHRIKKVGQPYFQKRQTWIGKKSRFKQRIGRHLIFFLTFLGGWETSTQLHVAQHITKTSTSFVTGNQTWQHVLQSWMLMHKHWSEELRHSSHPCDSTFMALTIPACKNLKFVP